MMPCTHLDGSDVVVFDLRGHQVPAVEQVIVEPGFAVVTVTVGAAQWLQGLLALCPDEPLEGAIHAIDGSCVHHCGAMRVVCV
jgi:hypothetical protein